MPAIRNIAVKNMRRITLIMVIIILCFSAVIQLSGARRTNRQNVLQIFSQVEQILDENSRELERVQKEYEARRLDHARTAAYIVQCGGNKQRRGAKKIAAYPEAGEIHILTQTVSLLRERILSIGAIRLNPESRSVFSSLFWRISFWSLCRIFRQILRRASRFNIQLSGVKTEALSYRSECTRPMCSRPRKIWSSLIFSLCSEQESGTASTPSIQTWRR